MVTTEFTDHQWMQIATMLNGGEGIPIESVSARLGVGSFEICQRCSLIKKLNSYVLVKAVSGALSYSCVPANHFTARELGLLGVRILGRGLKVTGRVAVPCEPSPEVDLVTGDIVVRLSRKKTLYEIPVQFIARFWELRPGPNEMSIRAGDTQFTEMLTRKISALLFEAKEHWTGVELTKCMKHLNNIIEIDLNEKEKEDERNKCIQELVE
jgi:hypothetical protein